MVAEKGMLRSSQVIPYRHRTSGMNVGIDDNNKKHASSIQNVCYFFFSTINVYSCTHTHTQVIQCITTYGKCRQRSKSNSSFLILDGMTLDEMMTSVLDHLLVKEMGKQPEMSGGIHCTHCTSCEFAPEEKHLNPNQ